MTATDKTTDMDMPPLTEAELSTFVRLSDLPGKTLVDRLHSLKKRVAKRSLTVRYDADIVDYYRAKGKGYQQAMNDALRVCMEAEQGLLR
ncbi:BrnA antitoxin family protein [Selenomonas ruminantium]|uniref:BrnA antitoxin family protein n=1 Tax=Selenomonas ruminantium TaxID=971 RepID=UPI0026F10844|nr:BrnA antitoxin family protein [Selenomonas ruminantium]